MGGVRDGWATACAPGGDADADGTEVPVWGGTEEPSGGPAGQGRRAPRREHNATACRRVPECGRRAGATGPAPGSF